MSTNYKYLPHAAVTLGLGGIGLVTYYAFFDRVYKKDPPWSDAQDNLEEFFKKIKEWLENHMGNNNPGTPPAEPGVPEPTTPDSGVSSTSFSSSHQDSGSSFGHMLSHVPVEVWAMIAVGLALVAIGYHVYGNQQQKSLPKLGR